MSARGKKSGSRGSEFEAANKAAKFILSKMKLRPKIALVLGSGLGAFADELKEATQIPYAKIPGFQQSTAVGHAGRLLIGKTEGVAVVAMQGRFHGYEGYSAKEVTFPMRAFGRLGVKAAILTNAAGGINTGYKQGALVVIRDHINLQNTNPLVGPNDERFGPRFPDLSKAYSPAFRAIVAEESRRMKMDVQEGVYAALSGPNYETPAEIRYLRTIGADLVGMSTVPEVIVARHMSIEVLGISCVTNMAAGIVEQEINHLEVLETGERVRGQFVALLRAVIPRIAAGLN